VDGNALVIEIALLDRRWHGVGDWPPSPFRVFQALVSGAYGGRWAREARQDKDDALRWLEELRPPVVVAPAGFELRAIDYFVPNNDLDAIGGDPRRVGELRVAKSVRAIVLDSDRPFLYVWEFEGVDTHAHRIAELSERLHTLGRGLDPAFARGHVLSVEEAQGRLRSHGGAVRRPQTGQAGGMVHCPMRGSLDSLIVRHRAAASRFTTERSGRRSLVTFRQPPKPRFQSVAYGRPSARLLYDLEPTDGAGSYRARPLRDATLVATAVRDLAARRLGGQRDGEAQRFVVGREAGPRDVARRVRIVPLPTIGHPLADPSIRRVLVEVPPDCPFTQAEVDWALSGAELADPHSGEGWGALLVRAADRRMLSHFGIADDDDPVPRYRRWQTVTPCVLPTMRERGLKPGAARRAEEERATRRVVDALRHAGMAAPPVEARVQAEPLHAKGARAETFASGRFAAARLRHVELRFAEPVPGPVVIGDGRWLGLGVMRPVREAPPGVHVFLIEPGSAPEVRHAREVSRALRRAVMARAEAVAGSRLELRGRLPVYFTGHDPDGAPARSGRHEHIFVFALDADRDRRLDCLAVLAPEAADRSQRGRRAEREWYRTWLEEACSGLKVLTAGKAGLLALERVEPDRAVSLLAPARKWVTARPYRPTRHPKRGEDREAAVEADVALECRRRGLPEPGTIRLLELWRGPGRGLHAHVEIVFRVAVKGPIVLGAGSHLGEGLFVGKQAAPDGPARPDDSDR